MDIHKIRSYRSKNSGRVVFVYGVKGTTQELTQFAEAQGEYHRTDDQSGEPLWFTTKFVGNQGKLVITSNGNVVPDMSNFDAANSLAEQYGGNLGQELARAAAQQLLGGTPEPVAEAQPALAPTAQPVTESDDL